MTVLAPGVLRLEFASEMAGVFEFDSPDLMAPGQLPPPSNAANLTGIWHGIKGRTVDPRALFITEDSAGHFTVLCASQGCEWQRATGVIDGTGHVSLTGTPGGAQSGQLNVSGTGIAWASGLAWCRAVPGTACIPSHPAPPLSGVLMSLSENRVPQVNPKIKK